MKLDKTFVCEVRKAAGDGSREAKFKLIRRVTEACSALSSPEVRTNFNSVLRTYGRVPVAICVAATLEARKERLDYWGLEWAREVLALLPGWTPGNKERAHIEDGIHPTAICHYARDLIKFTMDI